MHIYLFSPIRYEFLHQRPQKLADQFQSLSIPVTYVQPSGVSEHFSGNAVILLKALAVSVWYHFLAIVAFPISQKRKTSVGQSSTKNVRIISLPMIIPPNKFNSSFVEWLSASVYRQFVLRNICATTGSDSVAIFQNPFWGRIIKRGDFNVMCYDCLDDVGLYAGNASLKRFRLYEDRLVKNCDFVVATATKLESDLKAKNVSKPVYRIPNGVDYDWFRSEAARATIPDDVVPIKRPIVGYVGLIAGWTDYELVSEVARQMPDVSFAFVGPFELEERRRQLLTLPNIFWLDKKPYAEMPGYINAFDVCIIPFRQGSIAETTNPVKIFEYFALGKPVVATPMNELMPFAGERLLWIGNSAESFIQSLREALADISAGRKQARMQIAERHSWRNHAQSFLTAIHNVKK